MSSFSIDAKARRTVAERVARLNETPAETAMRHEWQGRDNARPVTFHTAPARRNWFPLAVVAALAIGFSAPFAWQAVQPDTAPAARLIATDSAGQVYVVGDGDSCLQVFRDDAAHVPADWRLLECNTADGAWNVVARR